MIHLYREGGKKKKQHFFLPTFTSEFFNRLIEMFFGHANITQVKKNKSKKKMIELDKTWICCLAMSDI